MQRTIISIRMRRLWRHAAVGLIAAAPAGGFLLGLIRGGDPDPNPIGRFVYGCIMAVMTPIHGGFPPHHEAPPGQGFNAWPYIAFSFVLVSGSLVFRDWSSSRRQEATTKA